MKSSLQSVESLILSVRGQRVILDEDLARVYGVTTARLNQQVKRNRERFPSDFVFQLTVTEFGSLMLQFATSNTGRGGRRKPPYAFTEHGAIMAASVLNSQRAIQMSVYVVRAFIKMRELLAQNKELASKLAKLERRLTDRLNVHEKAIVQIIDEIRKLVEPPPALESQRRQIGFHVRDGASGPRIASKSRNRDPLYRAKAVGKSAGELLSAHDDKLLHKNP